MTKIIQATQIRMTDPSKNFDSINIGEQLYPSLPKPEYELTFIGMSGMNEEITLSIKTTNIEKFKILQDENIFLSLETLNGEKLL